LNNHSKKKKNSGLFRRNIWIIDSSIIAKVEKHTTQRPTGENKKIKKSLSSLDLPITEKEVAAPILNECVLKSFGFNFRNFKAFFKTDTTW
jgi:hypothetical protein